MPCPGSNTKSHVSDYCAIMRKAVCPVCHKLLKITIPDRKMHASIAKFPKHAPLQKDSP